MQPCDVHLRAFHFYKQKGEAERSAWRRDAHFTALLMNATGRLKRKVRASDLYRFRGGDGAGMGASKGKGPVTAEERRRQALESFRLAKSKFWTKISDKSLADFAASVEGQTQK